MENRFSDTPKDCEESMDRFTNFGDSDRGSGSDFLEFRKRKLLMKKVNSLSNTQILNAKCIKDYFLRSGRSLEAKIPKHMVTLDERYLRRCLELIHINASKAAKCNISPNSGFGKVNFLWDDVNPTRIRDESICDSSRFVFECALTAGIESVIISSEGQWILGSVMGSKSMVSILKSPLLNKFGALDGTGRIGLNDDVKGSINYDPMSSPGGFSGFSSQKPENKIMMSGDNDRGFEARHRRLVSASSTNSTFSDRSSSAASGCSCTGMLQCLWKNGHPNFVFSIDDRKEVYVTNLSKIGSENDKGLDYMYSFYRRKDGRKVHDNQNTESLLVGKMKVSTSFSLCPNNTRIMETEFTLSCSSENLALEMQMSGNGLRKNKGFSKMVAGVFRNNHVPKHQRTFSRFGSSSAILEDSLWEHNYTDEASRRPGSSETHLPPNLEMAAVIVKEHLPESQPKAVGGWGLKFLKTVGVKQQNSGSPPNSGCCARDNGDCSTSTDVLIPASFHSGPRTRNGGPSGLIERWRSGGCCDCGGWDLGCPLTILNTKLSKKEVLTEADSQDACKSVELSIQGSKNVAPTLRMVNVHDGLYYIHFQSNLSPLQCFSVAVAFIHSQSRTLRPKSVQEVN